MKLTKRDVDDVYRLDFGSGTAPIFLSEDEMDELRAHLQAERDEELGRWRDPKNPDLVVYPVAGALDAVWVMYEGDGSRYHATRTGPRNLLPHYVSEAAGRYFAAHPEPKPWEKARPYCDEIWVLTIHGCEQPVYVDEFCGEPVFQVPGGETISLHRESITAGRRIWPEGEDK